LNIGIEVSFALAREGGPPRTDGGKAALECADLSALWPGCELFETYVMNAMEKRKRHQAAVLQMSWVYH
jgi:hypothetical protein